MQTTIETRLVNEITETYTHYIRNYGYNDRVQDSVERALLSAKREQKEGVTGKHLFFSAMRNTKYRDRMKAETVSKYLVNSTISTDGSTQTMDVETMPCNLNAIETAIDAKNAFISSGFELTNESDLFEYIQDNLNPKFKCLFCARYIKGMKQADITGPCFFDTSQQNISYMENKMLAIIHRLPGVSVYADTKSRYIMDLSEYNGTKDSIKWEYDKSGYFTRGKWSKNNPFSRKNRAAVAGKVITKNSTPISSYAISGADNKVIYHGIKASHENRYKKTDIDPMFADKSTRPIDPYINYGIARYKPLELPRYGIFEIENMGKINPVSVKKPVKPPLNPLQWRSSETGFIELKPVEFKPFSIDDKNRVNRQKNQRYIDRFIMTDMGLMIPIDDKTGLETMVSFQGFVNRRRIGKAIIQDCKAMELQAIKNKLNNILAILKEKQAAPVDPVSLIKNMVSNGWKKGALCSWLNENSVDNPFAAKLGSKWFNQHINKALTM